MFKFLKRKKSYIEYYNINSMWNSGHIAVWVDGEFVELINVDDYLEHTTDEDIYSPACIINMLKQKYNIKKVIRKEYDWR